MKLQSIIIIPLLIWSLTSHADSSIYCPQNHGFIKVGMTQDQVLAACGQPMSINKSGQSVLQKTPVTQLIYTNLNQGAAYTGWTKIYNTWSLPSGTTGISLEIDIANNKVSGVKINGSGGNATTLCGGKSIQIGDDADSVYSACGNPTVTNQSFITSRVPGNQKPELWVYQPNPYQPQFTLTFVNGQLQSID